MGNRNSITLYSARYSAFFMELPPNSNSFFSSLRLELPYVLNALAEDHGFFHLPAQFEFLAAVIHDHFRYAACPPGDFLVLDCDAGIDAYSLSIALLEIRKSYPHYAFSLLATDFLADNVPRAIRGVYPTQAIAALPASLTAEYFLRSRDAHKPLVRLRPGVRSVVRFRCLDIFERFSLREPMDVIFCRHVLHYFAPAMSTALAEHLRPYIRTGGLLFLGRETGTLPSFSRIGPAIYQAH